MTTTKAARHQRRSRFAATVAFAAMGLVALAAPRGARAEGFALDRYEPTPAGDAFFVADLPTYAREIGVAGGVAANWSYGHLRLRDPATGTTSLAVEHMIVGHALVNVSFLERFSISVALPVSFVQTGVAFSPRGRGFGAFPDPVVGDLRLSARIGIVGAALRDPFSLHVGAHVYGGFVPVNDADQNVTDEEVRVRPYVTVAGTVAPVSYSASLGYHVRRGVVTPSLRVDDDVFANVGVGVWFLPDELMASLEVQAAWVYDAGRVNAEAILGLTGTVLRALSIGGAVSVGMGEEPGTPVVRGIVRLAYAPIDAASAAPAVSGGATAESAAAVSGPDRDGDGVPDSVDPCADEPEGVERDFDRAGCPARDGDGDGVLDRDDACVDEPEGEFADPAARGCPVGDSDGDGVLNIHDACVDEPEGDFADPDRRGCAIGDSDGDGVLDPDDLCRDEAEGDFGDPDRRGCAIVDGDGDLVPDSVDACPDRAGAPQRDAARNGCPGLVEVSGHQLRILRPIYFSMASDHILSRSDPVLRAIAEALLATPHVRRVRVEGHTDDVGEEAANLELSERRARSVVEWLVEHGVARDRLESAGFGESRPIVPNDSDDARAENRRVEFTIVDPPER